MTDLADVDRFFIQCVATHPTPGRKSKNINTAYNLHAHIIEQ